jgi:SET domain-containing protein
VVFGYGSLYNHSESANVHFHRDFRNRLMVFKAVRDIALGEELTINYHQGTDDTLPPEYLDYHAHERA